MMAVFETSHLLWLYYSHLLATTLGCDVILYCARKIYLNRVMSVFFSVQPNTKFALQILFFSFLDCCDICFYYYLIAALHWHQ